MRDYIYSQEKICFHRGIVVTSHTGETYKREDHQGKLYYILLPAATRAEE